MIHLETRRLAEHRSNAETNSRCRLSQKGFRKGNANESALRNFGSSLEKEN